jgi:predicted MFS family arabinose efflux permease
MPAPPESDDQPRSEDYGEAAEVRNFLLLTLQQVLVRIGWIFKTESVIIPAFLDSIAGPGWMRGLLPVLNRVGQSVPAFFLAGRLKAAPLKKQLLVLSSIAMAVPWLVLSGWLAMGANGGVGLALIFLSLYLVFWCFSGLAMVVQGTLQGKLIRADRRGRLITASVLGGVLPAAAMAWWLLPGWLEPQASYDRIFLFIGVCFLLSGLVALGLQEERDAHVSPRATFAQQIHGAWQILRADHDYRRAVIVAALFSSTIMVFPHYQALAREQFGLAGSHLMVWVVVQNLAMGFASLLIGPLADRFGNRLALRVLVFAASSIPLFAIWLSGLEPETARSLFVWVFVGIGLTPIGFRVIQNYLLEISPPDDHPRYLSLSQLCTATSFVAAPFFGLLIDITSFELVFGLQAGLMLVGGVLTFRLVEPRHRRGAS